MDKTANPDEGSGTYRDSLAAALASALAAGCALALIDILVTRARVGTSAGLWVLTVGLYMVPSLLFGALVGVLAGGFRATFGHGALLRAVRALHRDRDLDREVSAALLAAAVVTPIFVLGCARLSLGLVGAVERKGAGALLVGTLMLFSIPLLALAALPVYRAARRVTQLMPRLGKLPSAIGLCLAGLFAGALLGVYVVFTRLEWRALALDTYGLLASLPLFMLLWLGLWYRVGALDRLRRRMPRRGAVTAAAVVLALGLAWLVLGSRPAPEVMANIQNESLGARFWVDVGRSLSDRDGDGFSALLSGPDCDDDNAAVNPEAKEILDNGIDDNCMGGDRKSTPKPPDAPGTDTPGTDAAATPGTDAANATPGTPGTTATATPARPPAVKNALIIMIDTVRADRLGVAGYQREGRSLTPHLDKLAQAGAYFTHAYSQSPNTPRSLPSIFTARVPSQVAVDKSFSNYPMVLDDNKTLFELLRDAGVYTVGHASHFYFDDKRNMRQGFDRFDNEGALDIAGSNKDIASPRIAAKVDATLAEMAADGRRFAMFVHLFEPHSTYMKHPEYPVTQTGIPGLMEKYDYEIAFVDQWVGNILAMLEQRGLADSTMVVVFSDHGEAFGVHRSAGKKMFFHGQTLYDELLRVPLIVRAPGFAAGSYNDVTMLVDVAPTVLDAMGIERPDSFFGRSLVPRMMGREMTPRFAYAELLPAPSWDHSARVMVAPDGRYKVYAHTSERRFELFDVNADPQETRDLASEQPEELERMKEELLRFVEVDLQ